MNATDLPTVNDILTVFKTLNIEFLPKGCMMTVSECATHKSIAKQATTSSSAIFCMQNWAKSHKN